MTSGGCKISDEGPAELRSTPNGVDFGDFLVGYGPYASTEVTIVNSGIFTISLESVTITGSAADWVSIDETEIDDQLSPSEITQLPLSVDVPPEGSLEGGFDGFLVVTGDVIAPGGAGCSLGFQPTAETVTLEIPLYLTVEDGCDRDDDGFASVECDGFDCDDNDLEVYLGAVERCNGLDDNCDLELGTFEVDLDGDGWFQCDGDCNDDSASVYPGADELCDRQDTDCDSIIPANEFDSDADGYAVCEGDCDDTTAAISPVATEICNGVDDDCDGALGPDEEDVDGDGVRVCDGDCDDANAAVFPGADELCDSIDNDCDGSVDNGVFADDDGDGFDICSGDCDDANAQRFPGNDEVCDGIDNDCDGTVPADEVDGDGDGVLACIDCNDSSDTVFPGADEPCDGIDNDCDSEIDEESDADGDGVTTCAGDCDDNDASFYPGAPELCDGLDNDCDGDVPVEEDDRDSDGFKGCEECNDISDEVYPGAPELCDGIDNDCDGQIPADETTDGDGDGFVECEECDDASVDVYPGAPELCDGIDNDCDGDVPADETTDADADGFVECEECDDGNADVNPSATEICNGLDDNCDGVLGPLETDDNDGDGVPECFDCDDTNGAVYPGAPEQCNGEDDDCDGEIDEDTFVDQDGDGVAACDGDCDDGNDQVYPGAPEQCNYLDEDCDGNIDEGFRSAGKYGTEEDCGFCGNDCGTYTFANASPYCEVSLVLPECQFVCDAGFFDTNGDEADGCECEFLSSVDDPFDGIDADCDGQDGLPVDAVYVSETLGSVGATGTIDDPIAELQDGIDLAASIGAQYVVATLGDYQGPVDLIDGISVYGGYDFAFEFFDPDTYVSTIEGTIDGPVVSAVGIVNTTNFQGFEIIATAPTTNGGSAIGIWVEDSDEDFVLAKNVVIAGAGWRGDDGASGGDGLEGRTAEKAKTVIMRSAFCRSPMVAMAVKIRAPPALRTVAMVAIKTVRLFKSFSPLVETAMAHLAVTAVRVAVTLCTISTISTLDVSAASILAATTTPKMASAEATVRMAMAA